MLGLIKRKLANKDVISPRHVFKGKKAGAESETSDLKVEFSNEEKCQLLLSHIFAIQHRAVCVIKC